jgi:hypothetical protein
MNELKALKERCIFYEQEAKTKEIKINHLKELLNNQNDESLQGHRKSEEMLLTENEELRKIVIGLQE